MFVDKLRNAVALNFYTIFFFFGGGGGGGGRVLINCPKYLAMFSICQMLLLLLSLVVISI